jgi:hypothetical protein
MLPVFFYASYLTRVSRYDMSIRGDDFATVSVIFQLCLVTVLTVWFYVHFPHTISGCLFSNELISYFYNQGVIIISAISMELNKAT